MKEKEKNFIKKFANSGLTVRVLLGERSNNVLHIKGNRLIAPLSMDFETFKIIEPYLSEQKSLTEKELFERLEQIEKIFTLTVL